MKMSQPVQRYSWLVLILFLAGCGSPVTIPSAILPTATSSSTSDPYNGLPSANIIAEAQLFSGPGNTGYELISTLPAGEQVTLLRVFGDFVKVHIPSSHIDGYLWKKSLEQIPATLLKLEVGDVPWISQDFIAENCMGPFTSINVDGNAIINDYTLGPGGYQLQGAPISLGNQTMVTIQMDTNNGKTAWIGFADTPFREYGEWYMGHRKVTIFKNYAGYNGYSLEFRDGLKPDAITIPLTNLGDVPFELVFLDSTGRKLQIRDLSGIVKYDFTIPGIDYDGTSLSLPQGLFPEHTMYLDCAFDGPTTVSLSKHNITRAPTGNWEEQPLQLPSLRDLAQGHGIEIIVPGVGWRLGDKRYATIVRQQASMQYLVAEMSAPNFWQGNGKYNFDYLDHLVDSILLDHQKIMATIVYGPAPELVPDDIRNGSFTRDEYKEILHDYVTSVVCRYKDKVSIWMVGNESVGARAINYPDFWAEKVGWDYVDLSFQWARECDPDGILMLNDSINDSRRDSDTTLYVNAMLASVKDMKARGIPIDAVGIQGHFFLPWNSLVPPTKTGVIQTIQEYAALGVDVYITELDVNLTRIQGSQDEKWAYQAEVYKTMIDACLESGVCKGFGVFGIDDTHSFGMCFSSDACPPDVLPEPLWFDVNFNPKPAFYAVVQSLQEH